MRANPIFRIKQALSLETVVSTKIGLQGCPTRNRPHSNIVQTMEECELAEELDLDVVIML